MSEDLFVPPTIKEDKNFMPTPEDAWDAQVQYIRQLELKIVQSAKMLKTSKETLEKLKEMFEENLMIMSKLEMENLKLKGELPKDL
jgi:hypothetical protein